MKKSNEQIAITVSRNTIIVNLVLFVFKLVAGIIGHSTAMLSDAVHSVSDVLSTVIVIICVWQNRIQPARKLKNQPVGK